MEEQGLTPVTLQSSQRSSYTVGAALMQEIQRDYPEADGIFCTNDDVAVGAYFECQRQGIDVPEQMAIAGFHGHDVGQAMSPRLASVVTPRQAIGEAAAKALLARIRGETLAQRVVDLGYRIEAGDTL
jgi:LacI family gluconate utilization system Gnt-I transcriptional repressor